MHIQTEQKTGEKLELAMFTNCDEIAHYWPHIDGALERTRHTWEAWTTKDSFMEHCLSGLYQVWAIQDERAILMVIVSQIVHRETGGVLEIIWASGDKILTRAMPLLEAGLEKYAETMGLAYVEVVGRLGWKRKLEKMGFTLACVTMRRPIKKKGLH